MGAAPPGSAETGGLGALISGRGNWLAWAGKRDPPLLRLADQGRAGAVTGRAGAGREEQQRARHSHS